MELTNKQFNDALNLLWALKYLQDQTILNAASILQTDYQETLQTLESLVRAFDSGQLIDKDDKEQKESDLYYWLDTEFKNCSNTFKSCVLTAVVKNFGAIEVDDINDALNDADLDLRVVDKLSADTLVDEIEELQWKVNNV